MKKALPYISILLLLFVLAACGMTEELDQAKTDLEEVTKIAKEQAELYKDIDKYNNEIQQDFDEDLKKKPEIGLFSEKKALFTKILRLEKTN